MLELPKHFSDVFYPSCLYNRFLNLLKPSSQAVDVTFKEDACRARKNYSARNLNLLRKFTLAILRQQNDKLSLKARRWKCSLQPDYLKKVLGF